MALGPTLHHMETPIMGLCGGSKAMSGERCRLEPFKLLRPGGDDKYICFMGSLHCIVSQCYNQGKRMYRADRYRDQPGGKRPAGGDQQ
jgi:hypothetical protein